MTNALEIKELGKQYRLGEVGTGTLGHDINRWWHRIRGKENPYAKIGEENDRTKSGSDYVWALKDISFDIPEGQVVGVIGRNGAGKSTLLKILSRVTTPTCGLYRGQGRIASLLEVGTGFHPELTGRENVFLNGAILGMTKQEIRGKFDQIVQFSGVERYIDTPVKRYSSGMYVRLAFAVAAHLEPEILIVDEVLAVGDVEFQKKCIGKMKDVSGEGRTVLFVSHNMASVKRLCSRGIVLEQGLMAFDGGIDDAVDFYLAQGRSSGAFGIVGPKIARNKYEKGKLNIREIYLRNDHERTTIFLKNQIVTVEIIFDVIQSIEDLIFVVTCNSTVAGQITYSATNQSSESLLKVTQGSYSLQLQMQLNLLPGEYDLTINALNKAGYPYDGVTNFGKFTVERFTADGSEYGWTRNIGLVDTPTKFELTEL